MIMRNNYDECKSIGAHWTALYVNGDKSVYFCSFWAEYIPKEMIQAIQSE